MNLRRYIGAVLLFAVLAVLAYGLYGLIALRLTGGDAYPPYSTLRADPIGAKLFHDSLAEVPGLTVERRYQSIATHPVDAPATLFLLGMHPFALHDMHKSFSRSMNRFLATGGRLVVCFRPVPYRTDGEGDDAHDEERERELEEEPLEETEGVQDEDKPAKDEKKEPTDGEKKQSEREKKRKERIERYFNRHYASVTNTWGVEYGFAKLSWQSEPTTNTTENPFDEIFEEEQEAWTDYAYEIGEHASVAMAIPWHSTMYFKNLDGSWRTLYQREDYPVVVERAFGKGSIVLCSDAYFISNEAIVAERNTRLLAHLVGANTRVLFDEVHFGIIKQPGVMELAQRYGLQGVLGALLLLAVLFIWKNATSLVPPWEVQAGASLDIISGEQAGEGFVRQLQRHIRPADLPTVCFEEWRKTADPKSPRHAQRIARIAAALGDYTARKPGERNPAATYKTLSELANEKKGRGA